MSKISKVFILLGIACIMSALVLLMWNLRKDYKAGKESRDILPKIVKEIERSDETNVPQDQTDDTEMTIKEIDGRYYVGYITIPNLSLELPVLAEWSYENLDIAPCKYSGSTKTNNLTIAAHN